MRNQFTPQLWWWGQDAPISRAPAKKLGPLFNLLQNHQQGAGKILWALRHPAHDFLRRKPTAALDLLRVQPERPFCLAAINPDMLLIRFGAGGELEEPLWGRAQLQADFLAQLAHGAGIIILPGVHVARGGRIPQAGLAVLGHGALLQADLPRRAE